MIQTNGSFHHLIDQLDSRLERIESTLDRIADQNEARHDKNDERHEKLNGRVSSLEQEHAQVKGGWKAASFIGGVAGAAGGIIAKYLGGS